MTVTSFTSASTFENLALRTSRKKYVAVEKMLVCRFAIALPVVLKPDSQMRSSRLAIREVIDVLASANAEQWITSPPRKRLVKCHLTLPGVIQISKSHGILLIWMAPNLRARSLPVIYTCFRRF